MYMHQRIVLIDDDRGFADALADCLRIAGDHEVQTFGVPDDGLAWLVSGGRADIVLLDLTTPGMGAHRFRALLTTVPRLRALPVVVLSGHPAIRDIASTLGAVACLEKPIDLDELLATIERHCNDGDAGEAKAQ
jgi:DNA-binding NtrC family response regulator